MLNMYITFKVRNDETYGSSSFTQFLASANSLTTNGVPHSTTCAWTYGNEAIRVDSEDCIQSCDIVFDFDSHYAYGVVLPRIHKQRRERDELGTA